MKPHPRIRKTIKWGGAAVTVLLVVVWIVSAKVSMGHSTMDCSYHVTIHTGQLHITHVTGLGINASWEDWWSPRQVADMRWWVEGWDYSFPRRGWYRAYPLWPLPLASAAGTIAAWIGPTLMAARRRARAGLKLCPKCGYDRAGIAGDAKCPECGSAAQ